MRVDGDGGDQAEIEEVPLRVEKIVREKKYAERQRANPRHGPIEKENADQEYEIGRGGEQQVLGYGFRYNLHNGEERDLCVFAP